MSKSVAPSQILQSLSDATAEIVSVAAPSVVTVSNGMGRGTGVVWSSEGYIVTCSHVVGRRSLVQIGLGEGKTCEARVIGQDPYSDVALLKAEGDAFKPMELGDSEKSKVGQFVVALANPFNRQTSATSGIVTAVGGSLRGWGGVTMDNVIVTDAQLNPGYSGGPLLDVSGKMIGLNTACVRSRGIAVPVSTVKRIVESLQKEGKIKRAYFGIVSSTITLPEEIATQTRISQNGGVIVFSVETGSPAKRAGLALGDVIVKFNGKSVASVDDLPGMLTKEVIGKENRLTILRGEKLMDLTVIPSVAGSEINE